LEQKVGISAVDWSMWWGSSTLSMRVELRVKQYQQGYSSSDELYIHKHNTNIDPSPHPSPQYAVCFSETRQASFVPTMSLDAKQTYLQRRYRIIGIT